MQLIRCTGKLQKELGLKRGDLSDSEPQFSYMGQWHANLIYVNRRKCVVFVNDKTRFNFIEVDVSRDYIRRMPEWFAASLSCALQNEAIEQAVIDRILAEYEEIGFAKTNDKSVLGSLNDLAYHYEFSILDFGGVHSPMIPEIIHRLNHMPMSPINWKYSIDALRSHYGIAT